MDVSTDSETLPTHSALAEPVLDQLNLSIALSQTESEGNILLQLLKFKTHLLEVVEELHIRRDAETRFEDQISKLVLEKQELEWEKESLQHQIETVTNQHTESLTNVKKQFQDKLRNAEEEKGKYQVIAELKDKEINNLKEELKSLQLLKYNLEKKSNELEQKLALQSWTKDSHLKQLGEVEKRFSALSRQCATIKQAHEKLEQNVDEAMTINKKLTSANEKKEAAIVSLKKELEEISNKLIKAKMTSVNQGKPHRPTGREQHIQQLLHQKLKMETEMNKKLREENETERAEKQEVIRSLQHTQQLLWSQTQTVKRVELELQTQRQMHEALKQEHEVMREKNKAMEDKVAQLMESYTASKTSWDKEKMRFLDRIKCEQEDLHVVKEAYDSLHQKHADLSLQAKSQALQIQEMKVRDSCRSLSVFVQSTFVEEIRREETLSEPMSRSELPGLGSLQHSVSSQAKNPDRLEDAAAVTKLVVTGALEGQEIPNQQSQTTEQSLTQPNMLTSPLTTNSSFSLCNVSGATATQAITLYKMVNNSAAGETYPEVNSHAINTTLSVSDDGIQIINGSCVSCTTASSPECNSLDGSVDLLTKEKNKEINPGMDDKEQEEKDDGKRENSHGEKEETNTEQQRDAVRGEDVKEGGDAGEKRGTGMAQTYRTNRREDSEGSGKDAETETKDRAHGVKEREKTAVHTPQTQIRAQTITDTTAEEVIDFMDTELPLNVCEPSDCLQSLCQKVIETDAESRHLNNQCKSVRSGQSAVIQEVPDEAQTSCGDKESLNHQSCCHFEEKPPSKTAGEFSTRLFECQGQSTTSEAQKKTCNSSAMISVMKQTDERCDTHMNEKVTEPQQSLQSQESSEQKDGQLKSVVTDGEGDSSAHKRRDGQSSVHTSENNACESGQTPMEKSNLKDAGGDITMDAVSLESEVEAELIEDTADARKSHENNESFETCCSEVHKQPASGEMVLGDSAESSLPSNKIYRSLSEWGTDSAEKKISSFRTKPDVSTVHQLIQGSSLSEHNPTGGFLERLPSTIPNFLKSKHNTVPLVIRRVSDLLNASSVSGTAASLRRKQQGDWGALEETCRERTAADTDSRASLPNSAFPVSSSSRTGSKLSWQTTSECSRAPTLAAGPSSESDWELSCSQEREDQQLSFRVQISKIEEFLNTERLRLPKRRQTEENQ